ncbi:DUF4374 domain-containing protein [Rufibacter latericius]|uniref:DUF4374 domain-containing protein n=1 Tax=Rufibacter latericius TaxID=2487040 RepID=A0A3M9MTH6_9BACT|nr:DUF4374 domain-containing protein [Rufibacter latericius]RNI28822.1 DUF4374 domain-containing protein [Rufibacter latericius]
MKYTVKQLAKFSFLAGVAFTAFSCSDNDDPTPIAESDKVFALGIGVTTSTATTNYVVQSSDLMNGTISLTGNGILQTGYRDYAFGGGNFYSIGGLGITDVNTISLNASNQLATKTGLTFEQANNEFIDATGTGTTMVGVSMPASPTAGLNANFYTVDIASNTIASRANVPMNSIHPSNRDWLFHTGMQVRGNQLFQAFYPVNYTTYATTNTDTCYVAIYSYPGFALQKVIKDTRTGPAGAFNTRSGLFKTENGDLYTVSNTSYSNGYSQSTKPAGILKIAAGATEFDQNYFFNTDTAPNGGKIAHAIYIGNNKLFAAITAVPPTPADLWTDNNLQLAIVDLAAKTITKVANAPQFKGEGGRSFAALLDEGKVYSAIKSNGVVNIYRTDVATATATKGAVIEGSFLGGIARLK